MMRRYLVNVVLFFFFVNRDSKLCRVGSLLVWEMMFLYFFCFSLLVWFGWIWSYVCCIDESFKLFVIVIGFELWVDMLKWGMNLVVGYIYVFFLKLWLGFCRIYFVVWLISRNFFYEKIYIYMEICVVVVEWWIEL